MTAKQTAIWQRHISIMNYPLITVIWDRARSLARTEWEKLFYSSSSQTSS